MRKGSFKIWALLTILTLRALAGFIPSASAQPPPWPGETSGPGDWIQISEDKDENGTQNDWLDVYKAYYQEDENYLYLKEECYATPGSGWPGSGGRYKWFIDFDGDMYYQGGKIYNAEYLLFVEDTNKDGNGDMYLINDTDGDGTFGEYSWPTNSENYTIPDDDYEGNNISDTRGGWRISGNQIEMCISWEEIGKEFGDFYSVYWAADQANPNLNSASEAQGDRIDGLVNLALDKTADKEEAFVCETVIYTYTVTNKGALAAPHVRVHDDMVLDEDIDYVGGDGNTNQLLDLNETWTFTASYDIPVDTHESRDIINNASVVSWGLESDSSDNLDSWTVSLSWESYNSKGEECDYFDVNEKTVYMKSARIDAGNYRVEYYDDNGDFVLGENFFIFPGGILSHSYSFPSNPSVAPGDWTAKLIKLEDGEPTDCYMVDDFYVTGGAIPEFPMVIATIVVSLVCAAAYIFVRKKYVPTRRVGVVR